MHPSDFQPYVNEPSEADLRKMLEARELELELERQRMSRKLTKILCVSALVLIGAILCFPASREIISQAGGAKSQPKETAEKKQEPFSLKNELHLDQSDVRFGGELMDFIRPPAPKPAAPVPPQVTAAPR